VLLFLCLVLAASFIRLPTTLGIAAGAKVAAAAGQCTPSSAITANFNGTGIGSGDTLWFSSVLKLNGAQPSGPLTIHFDQASISYVVNGTTTTLAAPSGVVTFSPSATAASTSYDPSSNTWHTTVPAGLGGNSFLSGLAVPLPAGLPGGVHPVTWSGHFSSDPPGVGVNWQWAAAVYTQFSADYTTLGVKPVDDPRASSYQNSDHAGTPESKRGFVTGGAMGGGGSNFTGSYSATQSSLGCPLPTPTATATPAPPTATATMSATPPPPTATATATETPSNTSTFTVTDTPTVTPTFSVTDTPSSTATSTDTPPATDTPTITATDSPTSIPASTATPVPVDTATPCSGGSTSISANFNGTGIGAGDTLWFSSVLKLNGAQPSGPLTIHFDQASISYVVNGATTTLAAPSGVITFSPSATVASTSYDPGSNTWYTTVPAGLGGNSFLSGLVVPLPAGLPGGVHPVTWSGHFSSDPPGVGVNWQWAAAVYTQFSADYTTLGVKPVDDPQASSYQNSDHAGTPESERGFVTGGAMGGGGSNFTGSYSGTQSNSACPLPASTPTVNCTNDTPPLCLTGFSASATAVSLNTAVLLTASTNSDVGPTADYIDIVDQSGTILASCGVGLTCTATVSASVATTVQYTAYLAQSCFPGCGSDAQSASISVRWS
jgi:hypothetical protein